MNTWCDWSACLQIIWNLGLHIIHIFSMISSTLYISMLASTLYFCTQMLTIFHFDVQFFHGNRKYIVCIHIVHTNSAAIYFAISHWKKNMEHDLFHYGIACNLCVPFIAMETVQITIGTSLTAMQTIANPFAPESFAAALLLINIRLPMLMHVHVDTKSRQWSIDSLRAEWSAFICACMIGLLHFVVWCWKYLVFNWTIMHAGICSPWHEF